MGTDFFKVNGIQVANIHNDSDIALFGIAVIAGDNQETPEIAGIAHFCEHMFFKGTTSRNWGQINQEFAKLGVNNNAWTGSNEVFYHTTCPKKNIEPVIDLMLDMFFNSTLPEEELEKEREVIIQEKTALDDDPKASFSQAVCNAFFVWEKGHSTLGEYKTIKSMKREQFIEFLENKTNIGNFIFICSGDIHTDNLKKYIETRIPKEHPYLKNGPQNIITPDIWTDEVKKPDKLKLIVERENINQANICRMGQTIPLTDKRCHADFVLKKAIGGGMYSMLFSRIREELGLCYSTGMFNYPLGYPHAMITEVYGYLDPKNIDLFIEESEKILDNVIKNGIDQDLFDCAKIDYLGGILRQIETSFGKASCMLKRYLFGEQMQIEEVIKSIESVKRKTCNELAEEVLKEHGYWAVMVPKK